MIELKLTLESPFMIPGEGGEDPTLDVSALKHPVSGLPIIPGTLIKGVVRDALSSLSALSPAAFSTRDGKPLQSLLNDLFGTPSDNGVAPRRARVFFDDLVAATPIAKTQKDDSTPSPEQEKPEVKRSARLARVAINEELGGPKDGALQIVEMLWPIGTLVEFRGKVRTSAGVDQAEVAGLLRRALAATFSIGSFKSVGFGRIAGIDAAVVRADVAEVAPAKEPTGSLLALVRFGGPLLVAAEHVDGNAMVGQRIVPGAALKGALADQLQGLGELAGLSEDLARVRFGHGYPVREADAGQNDAVGLPLPDSLAAISTTKGSVIVDMFDYPDGAVFRTAGGFQAPTFQIDWKSSDYAAASAWRKAAKFPADLPDLITQTRIHTAIDATTGTAKFDEQEGGSLFAETSVSPYARSDDGTKVPYLWRFRLDGDPAALARLAQRLGKVDLAIGKLGTHARVEAFRPISSEPPQAVEVDGTARFRVMLATPALMSPLSALQAAAGRLDVVYANYWKNLANGVDLQLSRYFAHQKRIVGYQALRYPANKARFEPHILTVAGSVFELTCPADQKQRALGVIQQWLREGLEPAVTGEPANWMNSPFPRENGYGAIYLLTYTRQALPPGITVV